MNDSNKYNIEDYKLSYRAMIPFYILLDEDLSKTDIKLYGLIEQMESSLGNVFYTNKNIAEILGIAVRNVQLAKRKLQEKNYLVCEYKEILIKGKKAWMHCWNTVKGSLVQDEDTEIPEDDTVDHPKDDTVDHPKDDTVDHPKDDTVDHPCNTLDCKAFRLEIKTTKDVVIFDQKTDKTILKRIQKLPQDEKSMIQLLKEIHFNVKQNYPKNTWKGIYGSLSLINKGKWSTPSGFVDKEAIAAEKAKIHAIQEAQAKSIEQETLRKSALYTLGVYKAKNQTPPAWCLAYV